jgi:hypothetical protein
MRQTLGSAADIPVAAPAEVWTGQRGSEACAQPSRTDVRCTHDTPSSGSRTRYGTRSTYSRPSASQSSSMIPSAWAALQNCKKER